MKTLINKFVLIAALTLCADITAWSQDSNEAVRKIQLPQGFTASTFYSGIPNPDGIAFRDDGSLLVVNEAEPQGVFIARRGDTFDFGDAFSTTGSPFVSPDDIFIYPDGTVFVVDGQAQTLFKIPAAGGAPISFASRQSIGGSNMFNPFGITIAPQKFQGTHVDPGDLIVADNGYGREEQRAVWAINPLTGAARAIAKGRVFVDGPIIPAFSPDGRLFVYQNKDTGSSRIVCLDAEGKVVPFLSYVPENGPLAINPVTGDVYFGLSENKKEIWCIPGNGEYPDIFASGFLGRFQDMVFSPDGRTLFLSHPNRIIEIKGPFLEPMPPLKIALGSIAGYVKNMKENTPYSNLTIVANGGDKLVSSAQTDEQGKYQLMLLPGKYTVRPRQGQGMESPKEILYTVTAGKRTTADFALTAVKLPLVMEKSASKYASIKSYRDTTIIEMHMVGPGADYRFSVPLLFAFERPNRLRLENASAGGLVGIPPFSLVCDGDSITTYMGQLNQYTRAKAPSTITSSALQGVTGSFTNSIIDEAILLSDDPMKKILEDAEGMKVIGVEKLGAVSVTVLEFTKPVSSLPSSQMVPASRADTPIGVRLWIGNSDFLIMKIAYELDMSRFAAEMPKERRASLGMMKMEITESHKKIEMNPTFSDAVFSFVPPEGAQLVGQFGPPQSSGGAASPLLKKPAPAFVLKDIDGKEAKLVDFKGKVLIVDFWATWCGPCKMEIPGFVSLHSQYASKGFSMIGISTDVKTDIVKPFVLDNKMNYLILMADEKVKRDYGGISAIPTTFVIDKKGIVRYQYTGVPSDNLVFQKNVEELLAEEVSK